MTPTASAGPWRVECVPAGHLGGYASIPSRFTTDVVMDVGPDGPPFMLHERHLGASFSKDYDVLEPPRQWHALFDLSAWAVLSVSGATGRLGEALLAWNTPGVDMLEGRRDLLVLWDIRVGAGARGRGVGTALFRAAEAWGRARACTGLKVETQNVNVAACRFYRAMGCVLAQAVRGAYPGLPDEVQLIWRKPIDSADDQRLSCAP
ncbi:N-acetyltransferase [Pseudorhodoferax sp. Leaf267]|uniref:GNAT family N-acetyltransferase n=1 Tax=Pseudorhodoferax sp. Leaf267 TaxID=1736316 RepID=UPI0006F428F4|nr:GNAT family N-acetyltransferase [Pseudorhodoferax sp. Leaf267]KQP12761.1 hypothetical protein ASF43_21345 [Pseudorhodoferax sp. Leaf267]